MSENKKTKIYRYKFSDEFKNYLKEFSKIHQFDNTSDFKKHWKSWIKIEQIENLIVIERKTLNKNGYNGDVLVKMYKSARYYFKNKSENKSEQKKRRKYIRLDQDLLEYMDSHINRNSCNKPEIAYNNFLELEMAKKYITDENSKNILKRDDFDLKVKKTYKNRFYNIMKMNNENE